MPPPLKEMPTRVPSDRGSSYSHRSWCRSATAPEASDVRLIERARAIRIHGADALAGHPLDRVLVEPLIHEQRVDAYRVLVLDRAYPSAQCVRKLGFDVAVVWIVGGYDADGADRQA